MLDKPIPKAVVYLDPHEFHSTWIGNKAVYRTRMALADDAELIILAPGVHEFGEDKGIDAADSQVRLSRHARPRSRRSTTMPILRPISAPPRISSTARPKDASTSPGVPAHLSQEEVEGVGFQYGDLNAMLSRYNPQKLNYGYNMVDGEEVFFIANPGLGLWAYRGKLCSDDRLQTATAEKH